MKRAASAPSKHHSALCQICRHADREEIDWEFLHWTHAEALVREYGLGSSRAVYRHARACGLYEKRGKRLRFALERIVEHVGEIKPTPAVILGAIRLIYQMDQKEQERASRESGAGGSKGEHSPVHYTIDSYPYFDDCFEPLPKEAKAPEAGQGRTADPSPPFPRHGGRDRVRDDKSTATAKERPAATKALGPAAAPKAGRGSRPEGSGFGTASTNDAPGTGCRGAVPAPTTRVVDARTAEAPPSAKVLWRSLAGRRGRWARRGHVIVPRSPDSGAVPP